MKYTVVWKPAAEVELADLWISATDRSAIAAAANEIDARLKLAPHTVGESLPARSVSGSSGQLG
jgi:hypothetical protein